MSSLADLWGGVWSCCWRLGSLAGGSKGEGERDAERCERDDKDYEREEVYFRYEI